jgi:hypothetical protein
VHLLIEQQELSFLLTGSSARKLRSGASTCSAAARGVAAQLRLGVVLSRQRAART